MSDTHMRYCRFDYGCPRCGASFTDFVLSVLSYESHQVANEPNEEEGK